ncbi:MAG: cupin domain-containing protein [Burkholderiaceae bacterium]|nr:cupin domain-containing protein [Burkholderiaceae bacterium]
MTARRHPVSARADQVPTRLKASSYPEPFASRMQGRMKRPLGDLFGLKNFGVNLTTLLPGAVSALRHQHLRQDEFVYILEGEPTLVTNEGEMLLGPGMCAGFAAGNGDAHMLINRSDLSCMYLEIGDRTPGDLATYPDDDLVARATEHGAWQFTHKDGTPY